MQQQLSKDHKKTTANMESKQTDNKKAISPQEIIIYQSEDGAVKVDVQMADETVWLTIDGMVTLFGKSRSTINEHILHIFEEGELNQNESVRKIGNSANGLQNG